MRIRLRTLGLIGLGMFFIVAMYNEATMSTRWQIYLHARIPADIQALRTMLDNYKNTTGAYPDDLRLLGNTPRDPWREDYVFRFPGTRHPNGYDIFSTGPDRKPDTLDDEWGE